MCVYMYVAEGGTDGRALGREGWGVGAEVRRNGRNGQLTKLNGGTGSDEPPIPLRRNTNQSTMENIHSQYNQL